MWHNIVQTLRLTLTLGDASIARIREIYLVISLDIVGHIIQRNTNGYAKI